MTDPKALTLEQKRELAKTLLQQKEAQARARDAAAPIAVIGLGCRYPGDVVDPDSFWRLLDGGMDAIRRIPFDRWDADALYDPDPAVVGKTNTREGGFIDGVDQFDPGFFGLSAREAVHLDPQQRLLLETSWEALERAGIPPQSLMGSQTGVFVGHMLQQFEHVHAAALDQLNGHVQLGSAASVASGRLSYLLGLQGPSVTVDTACSSSLVSLHLACQALRARECDLALAGGSSVILSPRLHVEFARMRGLAADGRCKSFSARADGVGWSDGCGMLVLKRLDDARRAGDAIWGVIRGSAINQDGRSNGLTAPNGPAQEAVLKQALAFAGVKPEEVDYVDAHGTGTPLGDPIEAGALAAVYGAGHTRERPLRLGSVKSNIGHTLAAAGVAGVIKVLLALRHEKLPRTLHAEELNPHTPWESVPLQVVREAEPWPRRSTPRLAAVSSFGISGTNAHMVIEEPPSAPVTATAASTDLFALSGQTSEAVTAQAEKLAAHLESHPDVSLGDVAYTLARARSAFAKRTAVVSSNREALIRDLRALASAPLPEAGSLGRIAFLCTGQGAQYPGMSRGLYDTFPVFREALDACAAALKPHLPVPLLDVLFAAPDTASIERLKQTELTQPAMFAVGMALDALWRSWGIRPQLLLGHSVGEYVAACIAGVFSLEDGCALIAARGRLMQAHCEPGAMAALAAPEAQVAPFVEARAATVSIAAVNGPRQTVIAGAVTDVDAIVAELAQQGINGKRLDVSHGFHSPLMCPMLARFAEVAGRVQFQPPKLALVSNVSGTLAGAEVASPDYWVRHVLAPVRFSDGMSALLAAGARTFVELGPRPTLLGMGAACLKEAERDGTAWVPSLREGQDDASTALKAVGTLWTRGAEVRWDVLASSGQRVELPTYPFQRRRVWPETTATMTAAALAVAGEPTGHPLLGSRLQLAGSAATFESRLSVDSPSWLRDHLVFDLKVIPGTGIVDWIQAAANTHFGPGTYNIAELVLERALVVPDDAPLRAQVVLTNADGEDGAIDAAIYTQPASSSQESWTKHAGARLVPAVSLNAGVRPSDIQLASAQPLDPRAIYADFANAGLRFGPTFQAVRAAWRQPDGSVIADIALDQHAASEAGAHVLHPALLDAALQSLTLAEGGALDGKLSLPLAFRDVRLSATGTTAVRVHAVLESRTQETFTASFTLWDESGRCVAQGAMECKRIYPGDFRARGAGAELLHAVEWQRVDASSGGTFEGQRVVLVAVGPLPLAAEALADRLRRDGAHVDSSSIATLPEVLAAETPVSMVYFSASAGDDVPSAAEAETLAGLRLAQTVAARASRIARILWVTERAHAIVPGDAISPAARASSGFGQAVAIELAGTPVSTVDVARSDSSEDTEALVAELAARDGEAQVALRPAGRYVARLVRAKPAASPQRPSANREGAILITGGLGALGLEIASHFVKTRGARHLALLGRNAPNAGALATIESLRATGARVTVLSGDVNDQDSLARALAAIDTPLVGVVHAAGVLDAALLAQLMPDRHERVLAPKARGAWNLHELTRAEPLDFFVLFSSVASVAPAAGQSSYAAANAFLDGLAQHRRSLSLPAVSLNYGPWAGDGMRGKISPVEHERMERDGLLSLMPETALAAFDTAIERGDTQLAVLSLDLERRRRSYGNRAVPSLWRHLIRPRPQGKTSGANLRAELAELAAAEQEARLKSFVRGELARALSLASADQVPDDRSFTELGVESLISLELRDRIGSALGIELSAAVMWDHASVPALTRHLLGRLGEVKPEGRPALAAASPKRGRPAAPPPMRMHPESTYAPIFALGGSLGGATYLKDLANELGPLQPFYTATYPGLEDNADPLDNMDDFAEYFLEVLRQAQPHGPYVLAGHSFGGLIVFEMARRLVERGETVLEVLLFDTWSKRTSDARLLEDDLDQLDALMQPFVEAGRAPPDLRSYRERFRKITAANRRALASYQMRPFSGDVTLIVPEEGLFGTTPNVDDWRALCGRLRVRRTGGNHATMVLPPHHRRTAQILRNILHGSTWTETEQAPEAKEVTNQLAAPKQRQQPMSLAATHSQRWMWLLHQLDPKSPRYNVFAGLRLHCELDVDALEHALDAVTARHDALRAAFDDTDGTPTFVVYPDAKVLLQRKDLRRLPPGDRDATAQRLKEQLTLKPFDLRAAPLARAMLITVDDQKHLLLSAFHHSVMDGLSLGMFFRDLLTCYDQQTGGASAPLPALPWGAADYARWEAEHLTDASLEPHRAYWRREVAELPRLSLPTSPGPNGAPEGGVVDFEWPPELAAEVRRLAQAHQCSPYVVLMTAFAALLGRYASQQQFGLATVIGNRGRPEAKDMLGCFVNTVIIRVDCGGNPTTSQLVDRLRTKTLEALEHRALPFDEIVRLAGVTGSLTEVCFVFESVASLDTVASSLTWERLADTTSGDVAGTAKFDLTLSMEDTGAALRGSFIYRHSAFERAAMDRLAGQLRTLVQAMVAEPATSIADLPLLPPAERQQVLVEWNATAHLREGAPRLHELFEQQAARTPDALALVHRSASLTYAELHASVDRLARHLRALGVGPETRVGLCLPRTPELLIGALGILKAGGAYVPLDPAYPAERVRFMLEDSGCELVLVTADSEQALGAEHGRRLVRLDQPESLLAGAEALPSGTDRDLAYFIYTSGSTGTPKAVAIEHRSAVELVRWALDTYSRDDLTSVLASTSVCFDLSVFELFVPLAAGGRVVLVQDALELATRCPDPDVRLVNTVPSAAAELLRLKGIPDSVRVLNLAGEPLRLALVDALYDGTRVERIYDLYGPSEDTTYSTWTLRERGGPETIGRPLSNTRAYVLDDRRQPVPVSVPGELYLAGAGLARGYWNRPELTAERFVPDPFGEPGARMYRTGDRVRWRPDGTLDFLGRIDHQVKLRGFRIELGEIESALRQHPAIAQAVTIVREDSPGNQRLCAYLVPRDGTTTPSVSELRGHLGRMLPHYMIPQAFVMLTALPLTQNGKINRKALPQPEGSTAPAAATYTPPQSELERTIASVWQVALGVTRVGRDDHFFELGGHSLLATQVASRLAGQLGREVPVVLLFQRPVLRELAQELGGEGPRPAAQAGKTAAQQKQAMKQLGRRFGALNTTGKRTDD